MIKENGIEKINKIVWWIPFRKLRDSLRNKLLFNLKNEYFKKMENIYYEMNTLTDVIIKENNIEDTIYNHIDFLINNLQKLKYSIPITQVIEHEDRVFIDHYVDINKDYLKGDILEFYGSVLYAKKYSNSNNNFKIATGLFNKGLFDDEVDYYFDFEDESTLPKDKFDCILATQVFMYSIDIVQVLKNFKKMLKPNGTLIITMPFMYTRSYNFNYTPNNTFNISPGGLFKLGEYVFGKGNTSNLLSYGNFNYLIYQHLTIKRKENEDINSLICDKENKCSLPMIVGIVYQSRAEQSRAEQSRAEQSS